VRKKDGTHSDYGAEVSAWPEGKVRAVFVDDLIDTGATFRKTRESLEKHAAKWEKTVVMLGGVVYDGDGGTVDGCKYFRARK